MRTTLRRRLVTLLAAPLLLGSVSAAAPLSRTEAVETDRPAWRDNYYSDDTYTVQVGVGYGYCNGEYTQYGEPTDYFTTTRFHMCFANGTGL